MDTVSDLPPAASSTSKTMASDGGHRPGAIRVCLFRDANSGTFSTFFPYPSSSGHR